MANKLFLDAAFIRIFDVYDNYIKKHTDYSISFEQFYLSLYQKEINLYFHTYNIGIKADIAIFPIKLGNQDRYGDGDINLYFDKYKIWVKENTDLIKSINDQLDTKVNRCSLHGGVFFGLNHSNFLDINLNNSIVLDFSSKDLYSINGEVIFSHDEVYSVCEQYFSDQEMPDINIAPTEFKAIINERNTIPELNIDANTGLSSVNINKNNIFIKNDDALDILNNIFSSYLESKIENIKNEIKPVGVSKEKIEAKRYAKNIADYLWRKDIENKIKIKEMAINVYAELFQTSYKEQLPDKPESLKEWIKDIAPSYAKESGRPKVAGNQ